MEWQHKKNSLYNPVKDYSLIIRKQTGVRPVCLVWTCLSVINSQPLTSLVANCQWLPLTQPWCSEANSASYLHTTLTASKCSSNTLGLRSCVSDDRKLSGLLLANDNTSSPSSLFIEQTEMQCGVNLPTTQISQRVSTTLALHGLRMTTPQTWVGFNTDYNTQLVREEASFMWRKGRHSKYTLGNDEHTTSIVRQSVDTSPETKAMGRQTWPVAEQQYMSHPQQHQYQADSGLWYEGSFSMAWKTVW